MWKSFSVATYVNKKTALCCLLLPALLLGGTANAATRTIDLHEAITRTIEHNPVLRTFDYQLKAQQGRVQQAELVPSPELSIELEDALGTGDHTGLSNAQATFSIGWVLERGTRQRYIDAARAGSQLFSVEADIKQLDAAAETARLYLVSLAFQARMINADKTVRLAEETIKAVEKRVKAGKTPDAELSRAQAELARRELEREDLEHELMSSNRQLAAQWGATTLDFTRVAGDITQLPKLTSFNTLKSQLQQNPEFAQLMSDQRLKTAELQLAQAQSKPNWQVNAGVRYIGSSDDVAFVTGITVPFGKGTRNPGRIAEASANLEKIALQENSARVRIETALYVMYQKLQHSLHVINTVREAIIPPLEKALTETRRAYNLGRYSYLEWRSVQAELLDAHNALIEASIDAHRNIIEIERLTGVTLTQLKQPSTQSSASSQNTR